MGVARYIKDEKDAIREVVYQSGSRIKPNYSPRDLEAVGFDYAADLGDPGEYPFTRSLHPLGYRSRAWTTRQYTGFGTPQETNQRFKLMIAHGQTGLNVAFDLPTQMGYDSDDPRVLGEVGRVGMAVDSLRDFETAFKDIPLDRIGSGLTINAVACIMLAMYQAVAEKVGYPPGKISATPQNDILKEMIGREAWIFPVDPAVRLVGDAIEYAVQALPRCNPVSVCGYHIRESEERRRRRKSPTPLKSPRPTSPRCRTGACRRTSSYLGHLFFADHGPLTHNLKGLVRAHRLTEPTADAPLFIHFGDGADRFDLGLREVGECPGDGSIGLRQSLIDRLGTVGQSCQKHPFCGENHRPQFHVSFKEETVCIERHLEHLGQAFVLVRRNDSRAQHEKICFDAEFVVKDRFMDNAPEGIAYHTDRVISNAYRPAFEERILQEPF